MAVSFESTEGPCRAPPSTAGKEDEQVVDNTGIQRDGAKISVSGLHGLSSAGAGRGGCAGSDPGDLSGSMAGHRPLSARL